MPAETIDAIESTESAPTGYGRSASASASAAPGRLHSSSTTKAKIIECFDMAGPPLKMARPTWGLATSLPALLDPQKHVCVRTSVFRAQASTIMPTLSVDPEADLAVYEALQKMVLDLRKRLEKEGLEPRDLFDVRNFIWLTLRKDAERKLGEMA